jgi:glutamate racemase
MSDNRPIGIFDSGIGGLTVLRQLVKHFPNESFIYIGDSGRAPWGSKSRALIGLYNDQIIQFLKEKNCKYIVMACNTSDAYFGQDIESKYQVPAMGLAQNTGKRVAQISVKKEVIIMATEGTIRSKSYRTAILRQNPIAIIHEIACPKLVPLIESIEFDLAELKAILDGYFATLVASQADTLIYACSHYPIIHAFIKKYAPPSVKFFVDPATCLSLPLKDHLNTLKLSASTNNLGECHYYVTGNVDTFSLICKQLDLPISSLNTISF